MKPLLFTSNKPFSGKSSICIGLGKLLQERGYNIGYMKPLGTLPEKIGKDYIDKDVKDISNILDTEDSLKDMSPLIFIEKDYDDILKQKMEETSKKYLKIIDKSFEKISQNKDLVIVEGAKNSKYGIAAGLSSKEICKSIGAKVINVVKYTEDDDITDIAIYYKEFFKECFGGIILNLLPLENIERFQNIVVPYLQKRKVNVFGIMPADKVLSSISIGEIARCLDGKVICANDKINELVESFMVGAMGHELALRFFRTSSNKVVITGGDRADIQLAAMETNTKCIVLTGNYDPNPTVVGRAEELEIPMIVVKCDTLSAVGKLYDIMGRSSVNTKGKLNKLIKIVKDYIDIEKILKLAKE
ncbi:MAG: phosphotransacetylase family protein [Actinomycetota bacterium]|nr:phosphotransacetylase family protein [Actinomycetota bacterium]